ncbi:PAS domain-containing protein [Methylobacterium soli]|uniref:PAS domain-containing protein n=1 Tax=Methylobacterium soli TaxID=553447 RepID=A0A6L3SRU3_9HYPH|nr:PAS domain-containing protein [Methylobacterium soli]KAB1067890.1 PAS domain-containing protein [Methylobacterium soli]GJE43141.1 hypothetical protein AEGHOMDF_2320 [Methylobacterium soli]
MRHRTHDDMDQKPGSALVRSNGSDVVGAWVWTAASNLHVLDRDAAEILTGDPDLADTELPLETVIQRLPLNDRAMFLAAVERAEHESGLVVVEYRVQTPEGTRWLLDHGRIYPATTGMPAHGHGVLIDITYQKLRAEDASHSALAPEAPLDRAAQHAIATREAIDADGSASLRLLIDMVLLEIGRVIARRAQMHRAKEMN